MNRLVSDNRLLKLAGFLETLPRGAIRMDNWLSDMKLQGDYMTTLEHLNGLVAPDANYGVALKAATVEDVRGCGFAACAVGWACTIPSFRRAGLKMVSEDGVAAADIDEVKMVPSYDGIEGFDAVMEFFGIEYDVAQYLFGNEAFGDSARPRPSTVANRIRKVVDRRNADKDPITGEALDHTNFVEYD